MGMDSNYPFDMKWRMYSDKELIVEADRNMNDLDRSDMIGLVRELAGRLEDCMHGSE